MTARARGPGRGPLRSGKSGRTCPNVVLMEITPLPYSVVGLKELRAPKARAACGGEELVGGEKPGSGLRWAGPHNAILPLRPREILYGFHRMRRICTGCALVSAVHISTGGDLRSCLNGFELSRCCCSPDAREPRPRGLRRRSGPRQIP